MQTAGPWSVAGPPYHPDSLSGVGLRRYHLTPIENLNVRGTPMMLPLVMYEIG